MPVTGLSGTLTNSGISTYRVPSVSWPTDGFAPGVKFRVQSKETLVLSDYTARNNSLLFTTTTICSVSSKGLVPPRLGNWRSLGRSTISTLVIIDVQITFYYKARYDDTLRTRVLSYLSSLPGVTTKSFSLPLRWLYPDAFYAFQSSGSCNITLRPRDFQRNQTKPLINNIGLLVSTDGSVPAAGVKLSIAVPGKSAVSVTTDATGMVASQNLASLAPLLGGAATGAYAITVTAADNPSLVKAGQLDLSPIVNRRSCWNTPLLQDHERK